MTPPDKPQPWYEYVITASWGAILLTIGLTATFQWDTVAIILFVTMIAFLGVIYWFRTSRWASEEWEGDLQSKSKRRASLLPFMKSTNELVVRTTDGVIYPRVSRAIYNAANPNDHLVKKAGERNVTLYDPPTTPAN